MRSAALINIRGDVDFFCFPEFDSPSVFASILDEEKGGTFTVRPGSDTFQLKQLYLPETNVLLTGFLSDNGIAEVSDFMPVAEGSGCHCIMRRITVLEGNIEFSVCCSPKFDYARSGHRLARLRDNGGSTRYLEALTNDTNYYPAQLNLAVAQKNEAFSIVQLYSALGGNAAPDSIYVRSSDLVFVTDLRPETRETRL
jgi:GH15 family glucan-1,4-alpha-glucosidase